MREVKIESKYKGVNFLDKIYDKDSRFLIDNETESLLYNIDSVNIDIVGYIVYRILESDTILPDIYDRPRSGLEFLDKNNSEEMYIFHAHLKNEMILIWYIDYINGDYYLRLKYLKHPNSYKDILKEIYSDKNSYDMRKNKYLKDILSNSYLNEKYSILNFNDFLKYIF